ncbi:amino acid adenylation domain-containing protein, partial [Streptomyces sp. NPDC047968]|uniref:amino acid adenylation domain-containing protein n=1 Tax=Streptomyces sp. NPDC047968 TaxID=3155382 RepID=UPI00343D2AF5
MIFTSGSTGRPKGVMVEHTAIVNRLEWMQNTYTLKPGDRVLHKTPAGFDVSVWELFWPLAEGVPLVIARPEGHKDPDYLATLIREQRVTVTHFVPSMLAAFVSETDLSSLPSLRLVVCSGEALPGDLVNRFHTSAAHHTIALHNLYGPTEAAVDVTAAPCPPTTTHTPSVPIGTPVWNTQTHILDTHLRPTPIGVPGELYLAGHQLARGYTQRPDLTAERFTANPYGPPGTRMYRTGDLARWRPDGTIDYLGRTDHQVKLRGLRIELGEIEAVLTNHPHIAHAIALIHHDHTHTPRLIAYTIPTPGHTLDPTTLRHHTAQHLPDYMVPTTLIELDTLPTTPNGKLDRTALPTPPTP